MGSMIPLSVLDLSPIVQGGSPGQSLRASRDLASAAERLGFRRYWILFATSADRFKVAGLRSPGATLMWMRSERGSPWRKGGG